MPTRNRAHFLRYALQSALEQTFEDYEIIVSDNCSSDDTSDVVHKFRDDRIRYIRTVRTLSMPDSWEFALSKAQGEWVTLLSDDDAICPGLLSELARIINAYEVKLVSWPRAIYYFETNPPPALRNCLVVSTFTGKIYKIKSQDLLRGLFKVRMGVAQQVPIMMNSCVKRSLINDIRQRLGRFILPPAPDFAACCVLLAMEKSYAWFDRPLSVAGKISDPSNPTSWTMNFWGEFGKQTVWRHVPVQSRTDANMVAEPLLRVKAALPEELSQFELGAVEYFTRVYAEMENTIRQGINPPGHRRSLSSALKRYPINTQIRVHFNRFLNAIRMLTPKNAVLGSAVDMLIDPNYTFISIKDNWNRNRLLSGEKEGFHNIVEAARYLPAMETTTRERASYY